MAVVAPLPELALTVGRKLFRHVTTRDCPGAPAGNGALRGFRA
jgi:hypothetical protein